MYQETNQEKHRVDHFIEGPNIPPNFFVSGCKVFARVLGGADIKIGVVRTGRAYRDTLDGQEFLGRVIPVNAKIIPVEVKNFRVR